MKNRFTNREASRGELAARRLSKKAFTLYSNADPLDIYELDVYNSEKEENEKRYYIRGMIDADDMTFEELQQTLEDCADALEGYEY